MRRAGAFVRLRREQTLLSRCGHGCRHFGAIAGVVAGLALALFAGRWVQSLLHQTATNDPVALGGSVLLLLAATAVASMMPARRAAETQPMRVLRENWMLVGSH